jgi:hypothetical protein
MKPARTDQTDLIEALAAIEHEQWEHWSRLVAPEVSAVTREKWERSWVGYNELPDEVKELDRVWARKVLALLLERNVLQP